MLYKYWLLNMQHYKVNDFGWFYCYQCGPWNYFHKDVKNESTYPLSYPPTSLQTGWWNLFFVALDSILVNFRQTILCSHNTALPSNGDPNKILCCYRTFLSHPHLLVLHHVEGNYTFIYYTPPNTKPWKLYQRQQPFNHPSRYTSFKRQSLHHIRKVITHSRKLISKASFISWYR